MTDGALSSAGSAAIRQAVQGSIDCGDVPGAVALVWRRGRLLQADALGVRNVERGAPMERSTIFNIASMSKPVTVSAALTLVEEGKLVLDAPITKWAPEFANVRVLRRPDGDLEDTYPAPRSITIEDLLTHRSGLSYGFLSQGPLGAALRATVGMGIESDLTPDEWLQALASLPLAYAPGERFCYGHSTDVLGFIVARAAGTTLRQAMLDRVFGPLDMKDTDFWIPPSKRDRAATIYTSPAPHHFSPITLPSFVGTEPRAYSSGGQGLVSTADDYLTFARMLLGGGEVDGVRVLRRETVRTMLTDVITPAQKKPPYLVIDWSTRGAGFGLAMVTDAEALAASGRGAGSLGAFGWGGAFGGWWQGDPVENLVLIWLQQTLPTTPTDGAMPRLPGALATVAFQKAAYAAVRA